MPGCMPNQIAHQHRVYHCFAKENCSLVCMQHVIQVADKAVYCKALQNFLVCYRFWHVPPSSGWQLINICQIGIPLRLCLKSEFGHQFCEAHSRRDYVFWGVEEKKNEMQGKLQCWADAQTGPKGGFSGKACHSRNIYKPCI